MNEQNKKKKKVITSACAVAALNAAIVFSLDVLVIGVTFVSDGRPLERCILTGSYCFLVC